MSCFAVSRLLKHKEDSPPPPPAATVCPEVQQHHHQPKNGHFRSKKANNMPNVEIVQEIPRESSVTPVPPSSPQMGQYQYQYQYQQQQYPRHMSPHRLSLIHI